MGACHIYKTKNYYKILTQSETEAGFLFSGEPVYLVSLSDAIDNLSNCVFESLKNSEHKVPTPKRNEYPILAKIIMKKN
jgi:hypothetical protein